MKINSKSAAIIAALAMATTGALALGNSEKTADAATVATVHSGVTARLYTQSGSLITNRALAPNTPWIVGKTATINGETMYQVSTNEYLKASDSDLSGQAQSTSTKRVAKAIFGTPTLYRDDTNSMSNRALSKGSAWQVGKFIRNKNNQEFIQVSTHEYADAALFSYNVKMTGATYIPDFGTNTDFTVIKVGNGDIAGGSTSTTPSTPSTTTPSTDQNQGSNTTTTTPSQPSTDTDTSSNQGSGSSTSTNAAIPSSQEMESALLTEINAARATKGVGALTMDPAVTQIAERRAKEISVNPTHYDSNGQILYNQYLHASTSYTVQGENIFRTPWDDLEVKSAQHLAQVVVQNRLGEGPSTTWNHYSNLMNPNATKVGLGVYVDPSNNRVSVVEDYAS